MFTLISSALFAALITKGVRIESDIPLANGAHYVKVSAYVAEQLRGRS